MEIEPSNVKNVVKKIVNTSLNEGLQLKETIKNLEKYFNRHLSAQDILYVEDVYVELLLIKWLQHDPDQIIRSIRPDQIVDFANKLRSVRSYNDFSTWSTKSKFSSLILKLYDESPRLQELEEIYVLRFVQQCLIFIQSHFEKKGEFDSFLNKFVTLMKKTWNLEELAGLLKFRDFTSGSIPCQDFVQNLLYLETSDINILQIQQQRETVVNKRYDSLQSNLTEIINKFLEPVVVKQVITDGRSVLEVTGTHIVWSRDLFNLECEENFCHVQEIRIVNASVIHADMDLLNRFWHGKNLVIFSETLIFKNGTSTWDVSGVNGDLSSNLDADNVPGESGGNVLLKVDSVEGGNLMIISNGGNGSEGRNGSPGKNGEDGDFIDGVSFKKMFPPPAKFLNSYKIDSIKKIKASLSEKLNEIESFYSNGIEIQNVDLNSLSDWFSDSYSEQLTDFFIKGKTRTGCEITLSFFYGNFYNICQSYLLYKGAPGKPGTPAGILGLGGSPGFSGDINMHIGSSSNKVNCIRMNGNHGNDGQPGKCGKPGRSGTDCGFMDKSLTTEWPKPFVINPKDNKTLTIEYSEESSSNNVYCPYRKKHAEIKYAEKRLSESSQQVSTLTVRRPNNNSQQATRKKTIDLKSMMDQYKINTTSSLANLNYSVETLVNIMNELMMSKDLETDHVVKESKITRQLTYKCNTGYRSKIIPEDSTLDQAEVLPKSEVICNYQGLKYKLKVLNDIDVEFFRGASLKLESTNNLEFHSCFNDHYDKILFVNENQEDFFSEYFGFDSSESRKKVKKLFVDSNISVLTKTILLFINVNGFSKYSNKLSQNISGDKLIPLIMLLERQEFGKLHKQLCKCVLEKNTDLFVKVSLQISQNEFLNKLYKLYQTEARKLEDWINNIDNDVESELRKNMSEKILEHGPFGEIYREFLSHHYNRNISFYSLDKRGHIELISNHNLRGKTKVHILLKEGKFYQLSVDADFAEMLQCQKVKGCLYSKILFHIDTLIDKNDIDKYAARSPFKLNIYKGVEKSIATYVKYVQIMNQDRDIQKIQSYFSFDDNILIRLEKLKVKYIGYSNILHYMALHFENEGNSITPREFCFILNFILGNALTMPDSLPLISWIIASSSPKYWLIEFTLLKLETYLRRKLKNGTKERWRNYMSNLGEKARLMAFFEKICEDSSCYVDLDGIDDVLYLMSCVPRASVGLENIDLRQWKYYLKDKYWLHQLKTNTPWPKDIVQQASLYFAVLDNCKGFEQTNDVLKVVIKHANMMKNELDSQLIVDVLRDLTSKEISLDSGFLEILLTATIQDWKTKLEEACFDSNNERSLKQIIELVKNCGNTSRKIKGSLNGIETLVEIVNNEIYPKLSVENKLNEWIHCILQLSNEKRISTLVFIDKIKLIVGKIFRNDDENEKIEVVMRNYEEVVLATVMIAIKEKLNITLRNTQKLAIMMFLKNEGNLLAQISTGEGKSLIIVCIAIVKAIAGHKVDIITSSHVLAERDAKEYLEVYKLFGLSVGHNSSDSLEERKKVYSNCQIVYGELNNFQQDYLLDRIYDKNVLGDRSFETILVDEVDSLLLDRGNNTLYLSHEIPGLDKLEPVFVHIWKWFNTPTGDDLLNLKEDILFALGHINKNCLRDFDNNLSEMDVDEIWEVLVSEGVISKDGIMMKDEICADKLNDKTKNYIVNHIKYLWSKVNDSEKQFVIPNFLKCFVLRHLDKWIESAQIAMAMENGRHYVVDVDRTGTSADRSPNITILDEDTGTDLANSQWENGLHQFLQLKHGCKQFTINLKAVFISNVSFIKQYKKLYGLSGTLGTPEERNLLKHLYKIKYVTLPTAKAKSFFEIPPITCKNEYDWAREIFNSVKDIAIKRSVLIICESVNDAMFLKDQFDNLKETKTPSRDFNIHTYTRDYEQLKIAANLKKGQIIIATNLAGRGTDIKLSENLVEAGGLHVCLSFLPRNSRVEEQAFGRVSRNGQPGSAQIIFMSAYENSISKIVELKKQRNVEEINRIENINSIYEKRIKKEEKCFAQFQEKYLELKRFTKHSEKVKNQLLQICLDKWAFWLEENLDNIDKASLSINALITNIGNVFESVPDEVFNYIKNPFQLTKLAFIYLQEGNFKTSKVLFDKVIEEEHLFSEVALYYRIVAKHSLEPPSEISELLEDFSAVEKLLNERISSSLMSGYFIDWLKSYDKNSIMQIDSFKNQQEQRSNIYNIFLQSIYSLTGHEILPEHLLSPDEKNMCNMFIATRVYAKCLQNNIIKKPQLKTFQEKDLTFALQYGVDLKEMGEFLRNNKNIIENVYMKKNCLNMSQDQNDQNEMVDFRRKLVEFFPSRELFWSELLIKKKLHNEVKYIFLDLNRVREEMPFLMVIINNLETDKPTFNKNSLFLYKIDEILSKDSDLLILKRNVLKSVLGIATYRFLKKHGVIHGNKIADIGPCWNTSSEFQHFDSLLESDFGKVGINSEVARTIIDELVEKNIITKRSSNYYSLTSNEEEINQMTLTRHEAYTSDVKSLLANRFAFRIAHQKLVYLVTESGLDFNDVLLPLQTNLHKQFLVDLQSSLFTKPKVNPESDVNLKKLYPQSMKSEQWVEIFCMFFSQIHARYIIQVLKEKGWLLPNTEERGWFSRNTEQNPTFYVNCIKAADGSGSSFVLMPTEPLPSNLYHYKQCIEFILLDYLSLIDKIESIETGLKEKVGQVYSKETPAFDFKPLLSVLKDSCQPTSECHMFSLNGFDQLMIVKEKKYSFKMKISVSLVAALGVAEIAAGATLVTLFPGFGTLAGEFLLSEGVADLIYSMSCLYTGYFSFSDYWKSKVISLTISATAACGKLAVRAFKSVFGKRSAAISLVKAKGAAGASAGNFVVQRIIVTSGFAAANALKHTVINNAIKQDFFKVGDAITTIIHGNIDGVIIEHEVIQSVKYIYGQFGQDTTLNIVNDSFLRAIDTYKPILNETNNQLRSVLSMFRTVMMGCVTSYNSYGADIGESIGFSDVLQIINDFAKLISGSRSCWTQIKSLVSEFLNIFNSYLSQLVDDNQWKIEKENEDNCNYIIFELTEKWKKGIVNILSTNINENVIAPLSIYTSNLLFDYTCKKSSFFSGNDIREMKKSKYKKKRNKESSNVPMSGKQNFVESEYNRLLFSLLKTERHVTALAEISKRNLPVDMACIKTCCQIVPTLLRKEGIEVPPFEVVMEINGGVERYTTAEDGQNCATIYLKDNDNFLSKVYNNRSLCVRVVIHILSKSLCPKFTPFLDELSNKIMSYLENDNNIESEAFTPPVTRNYFRNIPSTHFTEHVDRRIANTISYQHKNWTFKPAVDVCLSEKDVSDSRTVEDIILEGFDAALDKINHYISTALFSAKRSLTLSLQDFSELKYEIWPQSKQSAAIPFRCQAVHYELVVPLPVETQDTLWDFVITITLNSRLEKRAKGPRGAHICYEVRPLDTTRHQEKALRGHVLLSAKCQRSTQTVSSCHVAGELILPTGSKSPAPIKRKKRK